MLSLFRIIFIFCYFVLNTGQFCFAQLNADAIIKKVQARLAEENAIEESSIDISFKENTIYLEGKVLTNLEANKIIEIISSIQEVDDVNIENLTVESSKEFLSDAYVTAKAKGRIKYLEMSKQIKASPNLHIETTNGIVYIFGDVQEDKDIEIIKNSISNIIDAKEVKTNMICR
jgi:hyperosmotically inducible protein